MICAALQRATARASLRAAATTAGVPTGTITATVSAFAGRSVEQLGQLLVIDATLDGAAAFVAGLVTKPGCPDLLILTERSDPKPGWAGVRASQFVPMPDDADAVGNVVVARLTKANGTAKPTGPLASSTPPASPAGSSKPLAATAAGAAPVAAAPGGSSSSSDGTFRRRELLAIGCSTGGPKALGVLLRGLPADFPAPIVIVQHMPTGFTRMLAEQLDAECSLTVREVEGPTVAKRGEVWIAPGDHHIRLINTNGSIVLDDGPEENNCRPAVDVLFRSVAETYGRRAVGVILTGMGDDGKRGAEAMAAKGAHIIAQDQATSVVWGMAGAVVRAGVASSVLPIDQIAEETLMNFRPKQTAVAS